MRPKLTLTFYLLTSVFFICIYGCVSVKKVTFKDLVDTSSKEIKLQQKKIFELPQLGVYASNAFEGARLNGFEFLNDSTANVIIKPENTPINNSPYYAFKTWSDNPKTFYFNFIYPIGYKHRYIPKIKQNENWVTIDSSSIFIKDSLVTIQLTLSEEPLLIAAQEVHNSKNVAQWYSKLIEGKENYVQIKSIGKSLQGKNLPVLDICKGSRKYKDLIVLLTRQHPPEVTGYFAFQEFLQTILNDSQLADDFLNKYRVIAFPIMNPDGVDLGHWRHNVGGVDLNRDWSVYNQPEIKQTIKFIEKTLRKNKSKIILGIDFHSTFEDVFYTNKLRENTTLPFFIDSWFSALEANIPNYKVNEKPGNSNKPVSKGWFLYGHNAVGITYEIGDKTTKQRIKTIGKVTAEEMMKILTKTDNY